MKSNKLLTLPLMIILSFFIMQSSLSAKLVESSTLSIETEFEKETTEEISDAKECLSSPYASLDDINRALVIRNTDLSNNSKFIAKIYTPPIFF